MTCHVVPVADNRVVAFRQVSIPRSADAIEVRQVRQLKRNDIFFVCFQPQAAKCTLSHSMHMTTETVSAC